jgi:hypothetical protein
MFLLLQKEEVMSVNYKFAEKSLSLLVFENTMMVEVKDAKLYG